MNATHKRFRTASITVVASVMAALLAVVASIILKSGPYPKPVAALIGLMPVPAYCVLMWAIVRGVREMDEMQRRVQLEAAATAVVGTVLGTLTYGWLEKAGTVPHVNWAFVFIVTLVFYMIGLFVAMRHYR